MGDSIHPFVLEAIRRSTNDLDDLSTQRDIEEYLSQYDASQADGVLNNIKGITHELIFEYNEDHDGDSITAELFGEVNHPGGDVKLTNHFTGEVEEIQLKATDSPEYVRLHMETYPDTRVIATEEVATELGIESSGISNQTITFEVQSSLEALGMEGFNKDVLEYTVTERPSLQESTHHDNLTSINDSLNDSLGDILPDLSNAFATGGFLALLDILKEKPNLQKRIVKASIAAGFLDGVVSFDSLSLEEGFDLNPLFVASLGTWIVLYVANSNHKYFRTLGRTFIYHANLAFKTIKYTSYGAIGIYLTDFLTGIETIEAVGSTIDTLDFVDILSDGVDLVDGFASLGAGFLLTKGVKSFFNQMNQRDQEKMLNLRRRIMNRDLVKSLIKEDVPVPLLIGPYHEMSR